MSRRRRVDITDFTIFGYDDARASTTFPLYGGAGGTSSIDLLQQDYELRWTGVKETQVINGQNVVVTASGGSIATLFGASGYALADHPLNPNPGTEASFTYRIPFEVWNVTTNQQVNLAVWDRSGNITADPFNVWNYENRQYIWCVNTPYAEDLIDVTSAAVGDVTTWNWVIYFSDYLGGDVVKINYPNPLQSGVDQFGFTTPAAPTMNAETAKEDVKNINVFPNPYYGVNSLEINKYQRFVTFNHLPDTYTIRIFNLAGQQVATIDSDSPLRNGQYQKWDLNNNDGLPVASGLYIAYVDMPELGKTKILKFAIIQEQQILDRF